MLWDKCAQKFNFPVFFSENPKVSARFEYRERYVPVSIRLLSPADIAAAGQFASVFKDK